MSGETETSKIFLTIGSIAYASKSVVSKIFLKKATGNIKMTDGWRFLIESFAGQENERN